MDAKKYAHAICLCDCDRCAPNQMPSACALRILNPLDTIMMAVGTEPEFTNFAKRAFSNGEEFCETLDYIWLSEEWQVGDVLPLPLRKDVPAGVESFPSESEPSDHMLIGAQLSLPAGA